MSCPLGRDLDEEFRHTRRFWVIMLLVSVCVFPWFDVPTSFLRQVLKERESVQEATTSNDRNVDGVEHNTASTCGDVIRAHETSMFLGSGSLRGWLKDSLFRARLDSLRIT